MMSVVLVPQLGEIKVVTQDGTVYSMRIEPLVKATVTIAEKNEITVTLTGLISSCIVSKDKQ